MSRRAAGLGALVLALHAAGFPWLMRRAARPELVVHVAAARAVAGPTIELAAELPAALAARVVTAIDERAPGPVGPGLHELSWTARYRGGLRRRAARSVLVGPYQDPRAPPCSTYLAIGQALLDDGHAGAGTLAHLAGATLDEELGGLSAFPLGDYQAVRAIALRWASLGEGRATADLARAALAADPRPDAAYLEVTVTLGFAHAEIPIVAALVPRLDHGVLALAGQARANLEFGNRVFDWASRKLHLDRYATREVQARLESTLAELAAVPPPLDLGDGHALTVVPCPGGVVAKVADHVVVPLAIELASAGPGGVPGPIWLPPAGPMPAPLAAPLAIELDGNALNALLYDLWRTGSLDQRLAAAGLETRFNTDPTVVALLSVRAGQPHLPLPPTVRRGDGPGRYHLAIAAALELRDGAEVTPAELFGQVGFALRPVGRGLAVDLDLADLDLTCEASPGALTPCYGDLVEQFRGRAPELHGPLSRWFGQLLAELFVGREVGGRGDPARFQITTLGLTAGPGGAIRLDLGGALR